MKITKGTSETVVKVSKQEVAEFKKSWPGYTVKVHAITFVFDNRNGDLVDIIPESKAWAGTALLALSNDATNAAVDAGALPEFARR